MRTRRYHIRYIEVTGRRRGVSDSLAGIPGMSVGQRAWRPPADVYETPGAYTLRLEVAGISEDDVEICVYADALVIRGTRAIVRERDVRYLLVEIRHGDFEFDMPIPGDIDRDAILARYERGCVVVVLPRRGDAGSLRDSANQGGAR